MNTGKRLMKASRKFYIIAFAIVLFLVICDSIYICRDSRIAFTGQSVSQKILTDIADAQKEGGTYQVPEQGVNLTNAIEEKSENWGMLGFYTAMVGMVLLLIARKFYSIDIRAKEFYKTLPIKEGRREIFDYFTMLGIILISALVQGGILLAAQTRYNQTLSQLGREQSLGTLQEVAITGNNEQLLAHLLIYLLYFLWIFTWIYLCIIVTKNIFVGITLSVITPVGLSAILHFLLFPGMESYYDADTALSKMDKISDFTENLFSPSNFFSCLNSQNWNFWGSSILDRSGNGYILWIDLAVIFAALVICGFLICFLSGKRELSKGKLFYFPLLDYPFSLFCGLCIFFILSEMVLWFMDTVISLVIGFVAAVVICLSIHPLSSKKNTKWEVK